MREIVRIGREIGRIETFLIIDTVGVSGSSPLVPTILFNHLAPLPIFSAAPKRSHCHFLIA